MQSSSYTFNKCPWHNVEEFVKESDNTPFGKFQLSLEWIITFWFDWNIGVFSSVDDVSALLDVNWLDQSNGCPIGQARKCGSPTLHWTDSGVLPSSTGLCPYDQQREFSVRRLCHRTQAAGVCQQVRWCAVSARKIYLRWIPIVMSCDRLTGMLDTGGVVKNFVAALQQLTNPDMIFKVMRPNSKMT